MNKRYVFIVGLAVFFNSVSNAYAYLDPGTGSMILQTIAALGIGIFLGITAFWRSIKVFFANLLQPFKSKD